MCKWAAADVDDEFWKVLRGINKLRSIKLSRYSIYSEFNKLTSVTYPSSWEHQQFYKSSLTEFWSLPKPQIAKAK